MYIHSPQGHILANYSLSNRSRNRFLISISVFGFPLARPDSLRTLLPIRRDMFSNIPIPKRPWASLSMDFITDLPLVGGYDLVFVMVDHFTKMAHFAPCSRTITGEEKTYFFFKMLLDYMVSK